MLSEGGLVIGFLRMSQAGIKGPSPLEFMVPGDGMAFPVGAPLITRFLQIEQYIDLGIEFLVIVPFIGAGPKLRKVGRGRVVSIHKPYVGLLYRGMVHKIAPYQAAVPGPVKFGVRSGMDSHKTAAVFDVVLKGPLLLRIEYVLRGI